MPKKNTMMNLPPYQWKDLPAQPARHKWMTRKERFVKRYGILLIGAAVFTIYTILLSAAVYDRAEETVRKNVEAEIAQKQQMETGAANFLSDEASKENAFLLDAEALARDSGVWKTEEAFKAYCWNAIVRTWRADYPNSVQAVLEQPGQYDYHSKSGPYSTEKLEWAKEVLAEMEAGKLPRYLTMEHQYLEMRDGGSDCVLHTCWEFNTMNDDPWRYLE